MKIIKMFEPFIDIAFMQIVEQQLHSWALVLSLQFQHTPLYLEWAPMGVFTAPGLVKPTESEMKVDADKVIISVQEQNS